MGDPATLPAIDRSLRPPSLGSFLQYKLSEIQKKNPRFSLRSCAAKVDIAPGAFAELLHNKRPLSDFYAEKIATGLELSPTEKDLLFSFVAARSRRMLSQKIIREAELQMMASWESYAILNLMKTNGFKSESEWIAKRLAITASKVEECFEILSKLGLIAVKRGKWIRTFESLNTSQEIPSAALVHAHKQDLLKAIQVLEHTPPSVRSFTSTTMPINLAKLDQAKQLIAKFHRQMTNLLESGNQEEVYNLNVQLFPMTVIDQPLKKDSK